MSCQGFWVAARFFRVRYMARAIREAVRTMPAYTFTAEGSRVYWALHGSTSLSSQLKAQTVNNCCKHCAGKSELQILVARCQSGSAAF